MLKTKKHILSLLLLLIFFVPLSSKILDVAFHQHAHKHYKHSQNSTIQSYHSKCLIPGFEFSSFSEQPKNSLEVLANTFLVENQHPIESYCHKQAFTSFLLRAPPTKA